MKIPVIRPAWLPRILALAALVVLGLLAALDARAGAGAGAGPVPAPPLITGSFFQIHDVQGWKAGDWAALYGNMKTARISDHVIWQWTSRANPGAGLLETYYPTRMAGFQPKPGLGSGDPVGDSLAQGAAAGVKVWLGLCWSDEWWTHYAGDPAWLEAQVGFNRATASELWNRYGGIWGSSLAGFYVPLEVDNENFADPERQERLVKALAAIARHIHESCGGRPVMIAPFCQDAGVLGPKAWTALWVRILKQAPLDIIALQDGLGASEDGGLTTHSTLATALRWFDATQAAIDAARPGTQLWSDLETFRMTGPEGGCVPATQAQIEAQLAALRTRVKRFTSFSTVSFQDPAAGYPGPYAAYKDYARRQRP